MDSALTLHRFHKDRRSGRRDRSLNRRKVIEGNMGEALHQGGKSDFHLLLARGTDSSKGAAMERVVESNDPVPPRGCAEFPDQFVEALVRLSPAVAEENLTP